MALHAAQNGARLWLCNAALMAALLAALRLNMIWPPPLPPPPTSETPWRMRSTAVAASNGSAADFWATLRNARDAIDYLRRMQTGRAEVAPVVELERPVRVGECQCGYCAPQLRFTPSFQRVDTYESPNKNNNKNTATTLLRHRWTTASENNAAAAAESDVFYLFSAYFDARPNSLFPSVPSVQILASVFDYELEERRRVEPLYCHFAAADTAAIETSVEAHVRVIWQRGWDPRSTFYNALLITCPLAAGRWNFAAHAAPPLLQVTVSVEKCPSAGILNFIPVHHVSDSPAPPTSYSAGRSPRIGVCVKGMDFRDSDLSLRRFVEWLELQYAMGADSVTVYTYRVPPKIDAIFRVYRRTSDRRLNIIEISLPGNSPNEPSVRHAYIARNRQQKRRHELVPYNDCFYRYSQAHDYVLIVDIDEVVVPLTNNKTWPEMLAEFEREARKRIDTSAQLSAISVQNVFVFDDRQNAALNVNDLSLFDANYRSAVIQERGLYGKSFINTRSIASVFNHFALHRLHANVSRTTYIDESVALKFHYKSDCPAELQKECDQLKERVDSTALERFRRTVTARVERIFAELQE